MQLAAQAAFCVQYEVEFHPNILHVDILGYIIIYIYMGYEVKFDEFQIVQNAWNILIGTDSSQISRPGF